MKVCTDACLLGAWAADQVKDTGVKDVLDIGTGTGLLSLMLAQKNNATIDAIEINEDAANQAAENIASSAWAKNIDVFHICLEAFTPAKKYDLIICNPPFFEDSLRSDDAHKNAAKHDTTLRLEVIVSFVKKYLNPGGNFILLIPFVRTNQLLKIAKDHGLFIRKKLLVMQTPRHDYFRSIIMLSETEMNPPSINELTIHDAERQYTDGFVALLKDYYLNM